MIKHIVVVKVKDSAEGATRKENAQALKSKLESLKSIKQAKNLVVGFPLNSTADWDVSLHCDFENASDMDIYRKHPDHMKVVEFLNKVQQERKLIDFEF